MESFVNAPDLLFHMAEAQATRLLLDAPSPPTFFSGERVLRDGAYDRCLSAEECKLLVESLLSDEQKKTLDKRGAVLAAFEIPTLSRFKLQALRKDGVTCAVITTA